MTRLPTNFPVRSLLASCLLIGAGIAAAATPQAPASLAVPVIPAPQQVQPGTAGFTIDSRTAVIAADGIPATVAGQFLELLAKTSPLQLQWHSRNTRAANGIRFELVTSGAKAVPGSYTLEVAGNGVTLRAADAAGLFNASMSLLQMLTAEADARSVSVPAVRITDAPRFS